MKYFYVLSSFIRLSKSIHESIFVCLCVLRNLSHDYYLNAALRVLILSFHLLALAYNPEMDDAKSDTLPRDISEKLVLRNIIAEQLSDIRLSPDASRFLYHVKLQYKSGENIKSRLQT